MRLGLEILYPNVTFDCQSKTHFFGCDCGSTLHTLTLTLTAWEPDAVIQAGIVSQPYCPVEVDGAVSDVGGGVLSLASDDPEPLTGWVKVFLCRELGVRTHSLFTKSENLGRACVVSNSSGSSLVLRHENTAAASWQLGKRVSMDNC